MNPFKMKRQCGKTEKNLTQGLEQGWKLASLQVLSSGFLECCGETDSELCPCPKGNRQSCLPGGWAGAALALRPYTCHPTSIQTGKELVNYTWALGKPPR